MKHLLRAIKRVPWCKVQYRNWENLNLIYRLIESRLKSRGGCENQLINQERRRRDGNQLCLGTFRGKRREFGAKSHAPPRALAPALITPITPSLRLKTTWEYCFESNVIRSPPLVCINVDLQYCLLQRCRNWTFKKRMKS